MACARPPGSGTLCHPRRASSSQVARASSKQEPGSTRRVTARDLQRINKNFGSNQYPAFSPTDQLGYGPAPPPPPPPPPASPPQQPQQQTSKHQAHSQNSNGGATSTQTTGSTPVRPSAPPAGGASKQNVAGAHREGDKKKGAERTRLAAAAASAAVAIEAATTWSELRHILSRSAHLGPDTLVLLAKQMDVLASNTQLSDETKLSGVQALAAAVSAAARLHIGSFSVKQLSGLLRGLLSISWMPDDGWLLAADTATLGAMSDMLKGGDVQGGVDCDGMQDILTLAAAFLAGNYTPQAAWLRLFEGQVQQLLAGLALEALQAAKEDARAATTPPRSVLRPASVHQGGLIQLPQQVEADQVVMPDGSTVHFSSQTMEMQQQRAHQKLFGGPLRPLSLSPAAWASLVQAILGWDIPLDHQGIQSYIDASFGAFRASAKLLKAASKQQHQTSPEAAHSLYTTTLNLEVLADMAALPLQLGARPDEAWAEVLYEATAAALEHTPVPNEDEDADEKLTAQVLFEVRPPSVAMLLEVLGEVGVTPDPQWVAAVLGGSAACTHAVGGDDIAVMVMKVDTLKLDLQEPARAAALKLAERAHLMWAEGIEIEAEYEHRTREQLRSKDGRGQGTGEGVRGDDGRDANMGFSADGILALFLGLLGMGVGGRLGGQWMEAFGQQVTRHCHAIEAEQAVTFISCVSRAGMALPASVLLPLMGRVLQVCAPPPPPANARAGALTPSPPPTPTSPLPQDRMSDLLLALVQQQQVQLPKAWMEPLQRLVNAHLVHMKPLDVVHALKVMGSVAGHVPPDFVTSLFHYYARTPDLHTPEGCVGMAQALARVEAPQECLKAVEEASLTILPTASASGYSVMHNEDPSPLSPPSAWTYQLLAWAQAAHMPSPAWWQGLVEGTGHVLGCLPASYLANLMAGYGALRMHDPPVPSFTAAWADAVLGEVQARLEACASPGSTTGAADPVGDQDEGGKEEDGKKDEEEVVEYLLKGLAAFMQPHASPMCAAMERACMALPLRPALLGACLAVFVESNYTPSDAWMHGAAATFSERMNEASNDDLCACMLAAARMKGMHVHMPPAFLARVLEAAMKEADSGRMAPSQIVTLLTGAGEAGCGAHSSASTVALTLLMDCAASMCDNMDVREVCNLLEAVRKLPLQPTRQWTATVLRGLEERDVTEDGPEAVQKLLAALDAWEPPMSASLLATLSQAVTRMGRASLEAAGMDGGAEAAALGETSVLLLQRVVNSDRGRLKVKGSMGEGEASECMSVMGELLKQEILKPQVHANLLYSAATMATAACRRAAAAAAAAPNVGMAGFGPVPVTVAAERMAAAKSAAEAAAASVPLPAWVHGLLAVAVPMTHATMPRYSSSDLIITLSSLSALKAKLPPSWLEAVWEHSMPQLRALSTDELAALLNSVSTVVAATSTRPPLSWEARLMEVVGARAPHLTVQESNTLLAALAPTGLLPPKTVVQKLLDSALEAQQVAAARVDAARSAAQTAEAGAAGGRSGAQPASTPAASPPTTGSRGSDNPVAVFSTRGVRGARRTAKSGASQGAAPASDTSPSAALAAATAAADKQAVQLVQLIAFVGSELGYEPSRLFMEACQPLLAPALSSHVLTDRQRSMVSGLLHDLAHP